MPYVFRYHPDGMQNTNWFVSGSIGPELIDGIEAQDGEGSNLPTSIPSPFARIDLVKSAFKNVVRSKNLAGYTDDHKLISDALDIGQIFFNYKNHHESLLITKWNLNDQIKHLIQSSNTFHKLLGDSLNLFLIQDSQSYNFDLINDIFVLKYRGKIIGGTSPATLFFAAPNMDDCDGIEISFGNDRMLDNVFRSLHERDKEYVRYLFALRNCNPDLFNNRLQAFSGYLDLTVEEIAKYDFEFAQELGQIGLDYLNQLIPFGIPGNAGVIISPLQGVTLSLNRDPKPSNFFKINSSKFSGVRPLVLPIDSFTKPWPYLNENWDSRTVVPFFDANQIDQRRLPSANIRYPYLTMNDFLEPNLLELPYQIDSDRFLTIGNKKYLLPLTMKFFEYFTVDDLLEGKVRLELPSSNFPEIQRIKLSIPVGEQRDQFIVYEKVYRLSNIQATSRDREGSIINQLFGLAIFPFIKNLPEPVYYNIGLYCIGKLKDSFNIFPFNSEADSLRLDCSRHTRNLADVATDVHTEHFAIKSNFDGLQLVAENGVCGIIIPKFRPPIEGTSSLSFAIDFGTTSTHIESKGDNLKPLNIADNLGLTVGLRDASISLSSLRTETKRFIEIGENDYLSFELPPKVIGGQESLVRFPIRTATYENKNIAFNRPIEIFSHLNVGYLYEKLDTPNYLNAVTNLKWKNLNEQENRVRLKSFLKELLFLCKYICLKTGAALANTRLVFFYPISMEIGGRQQLFSIWHDSISGTFGQTIPSGNTLGISESIAPFYFYNSKMAIPALTAPVVSIDIGGGTSDVVVFEGAIPKYVTSFQFAGNSIFGDGFNSNPNLNGFVKKYAERFLKQMEANGLKSSSILRKALNTGMPSVEIINFLLSLQRNQHVQQAGINIDLSEELKFDNDLKIVFFIFFTALFYHIAQLMKEEGSAKPGVLLFSGNGAKSLLILAASEGANLKPVESLASEIFNMVYSNSSQVNSNIRIEINSNPKELTAQGGLLVNATEAKANEDSLRSVIHFGQQSNDKSLSRLSGLDDISDDVEDIIIENFSNYINLYLKLVSKGYLNSFSITPIVSDIFIDIASDKDLIRNYLRQGIDAQREVAGIQGQPIQETFFFYPFIGLINNLAYKIISQ